MFALPFDRLLNTGRDASEWADGMLLPTDAHSTAQSLSPLLSLSLALSLCPPLHIRLSLSPLFHLCCYMSLSVYSTSPTLSLSVFLLHCAVSLSMPLSPSVDLSQYPHYNKYPHILCIRQHISAWLNLKCDVCFLSSALCVSVVMRRGGG